MKRFLNRLLKVAAYSVAGIVILMAIAVGLFRLFLPRLPEYQDEIKGWASEAIGMQVEFSGMDARWGLSGPELKFYGAELLRPEDGTRLIAAEEVGIGVSLVRLLQDRTLVVDTVTVSETSVELRQVSDGSWLVQGAKPGNLLLSSPADPGSLGSIDVFGDDIELQVIRPGDERPAFFNISQLQVRRDESRIAADATIRLPEDIGRDLDIVATQLLAGDDRSWHIQVEADDLNLRGASDLIDHERYTVASGAGDLELALAYANERIVSATASFDFENLALGSGLPFAVNGRVDVNNDLDGWLIAVDDMLLRTPTGDSPRTRMRVETSTDQEGRVVMLDATVTYFNLADIGLAADWFDDERRQLFDAYSPDGELREFEATISNMDTDAPSFSVVAVLDNIGLAANNALPGIRGFSGNLRADHTSGLLEINSGYATLSLPEYLNEPIDIDAVSGTVIWRRSGERTTILSDSIAVRNPVFESESNIEIVIDGDESPVIDLASTWSIADISAAKRYIPQSILKPKLYAWFQDALVSGEIPRGRTQFNGPLDKFPFDNGEGRMLIEATARNTTLRYLKTFPASQISEVDVVLENARLSTNRNRSVSEGIEVVDAVVEIADLRKPVLSIDSYSSATLQSIHDFVTNSAISRVFGGQLDKVSVAGDASFTLDLVVPLLDWRSFEFTARILSNNGTLQVAGLNPPITDLSGAVTIEKDLISSEALGGTFLGEPVAIELLNAPPDKPGYRVVAHASGAATGAALVEELGVPLSGRLDGRADYVANVFFPRAGVATPEPLSVSVRSDLAGMSLDLPAPFRKSAEEARGFSGELNFMPGGERIESRGATDGAFAWDISVIREAEAWDFDRGMLVLGDTPMSEPDVRGLHIRGRAERLSLEDWLRLSRQNELKRGVAERIRSIDLEIDHLYVIGQHLTDHRIRVDRSARDWLVQFNGDLVTGSVFVPYELQGDRALILDMERLVLPGDDTRDEDAEYTPIDPRSLPSISLKTAELGIGSRFFGAVEAEIVRTPAGLATESLLARDPTFEIVADGRWELDDSDATGYRTSLKATLNSTDVVQTMRRLDYEPGIVSGDMGMLFDMSWSGGPRLDFLESLDGEVQVRFGSGQLDEVDPGAGRMFGLMSITALPRRLSLDFRDVFQKGFAFDEISGEFRISQGTAFTCNLTLEGPAAAVGIVGMADLVARDYDQTAVVSANVGNTLPVVGAVVAGPQVGAALLLFSQIFKDPLQDLGQVFYSVNGSFDEPVVESASAEAFATSGQLARCVNEEEAQ